MKRCWNVINRRRVVQAGLVAGSLIALFLVLREVEWSMLSLLLQRVRWPLILTGVLVFLLSQLITVVRWQYLLHTSNISFSKLALYLGAGLFSNTFLPSGIGGDGVRIMLLRRHVALRRATLTVVIDRLMGLVALVALLGLGFIAGLPPGLHISGRLPRTLQTTPLVVALLVLVCAAVVLFLWSQSVRGIVLRFVRFDAGVTFANEGIEWRSRRGVFRLLGAYVISIAANLVTVGAYWLLLRAVGLNVGLVVALWVVLAVGVSLLFPISINGLGVQEAMYVAVLAAYGVPHTPALLAALLTRLVVLLVAALGGIWWITQDQPLDPSRQEAQLIRPA